MSGSQWSIRRVALMSTGSEILQGQYADSNARYLAEKLTLRGVQCISIAAAPDDPAAIERVLLFSAANADLVICTGGLGPTKDDVNRFVFERVLGRKLRRDEGAIESMKLRFKTRGWGEMPSSNEVQALLPEDSIPLYNEWGTAPGFLALPIGTGSMARCGLLALPGPPGEMKPMFEQLALPVLRDYLPAGSGAIRTIHTYGMGESRVGQMVEDMFAPQPQMDFTILAKRHGVDLRICAYGENNLVVQSRIQYIEKAVLKRVTPEIVYGTDDETIAHAVGVLLKSRGAWVTTAESCTGGMIAEMLTDVPGSSEYVGECHVTYSNAAKMRVLGVKEETLKQYGAVSHETAMEMAEGARRVSGADYAISVTGVAGPGGGSNDKPVGLVYIGIASPRGTTVSRQQFMGDRSSNREQSARVALNLLRLELLKAKEAAD